VQVLLGQGLKMAYDPMVDMIAEDQMLLFLDNIVEVTEDVANAMPTHAEFIDRHCKAPAMATVAG